MLTFKHYDDAVVNYFRGLYDWSVYASPDRAFEIAAMTFEDKVPLPLISVYRSEFALNPAINRKAFFRGKTIDMTENNIYQERMLPLLFSYQMDLWGDKDATVNHMFSELLFAIIEDPILNLEVDGYKGTREAALEIQEIQNNSDSVQYSSRGRLYRLTAIFQVKAYIAKLEERQKFTVVPEFFDYHAKKIE